MNSRRFPTHFKILHKQVCMNDFVSGPRLLVMEDTHCELFWYSGGAWFHSLTNPPAALHCEL